MALLQLGPIGPEIIIILLVFPVLLLLPVGMGYWVYIDANQRGNDNAVLWALVVASLTFVTFFGGFIALAIYIWDRD